MSHRPNIIRLRHQNPDELDRVIREHAGLNALIADGWRPLGWWFEEEHDMEMGEPRLLYRELCVLMAPPQNTDLAELVGAVREEGRRARQAALLSVTALVVLGALIASGLVWGLG